MTRKELNQMCTSPVRSSQIKELQDFLTRLKKQNSTDIPGLFRKFFFTECIIFLFFSILTRNPSVELFLSILPFELMVLAAYVIALIAAVCYNTRTTRHIVKALRAPEYIRCCPDCYRFIGEKTEHIGNDLSSPAIRSALFQKSSSPLDSGFSVSLRFEGLFFDTLKPECLYKIYAVDGKYICFVLHTIS